MTIDADLVRSWSERLCRLPPAGPAAAAEAPGLTGSLVATLGVTLVRPPPPGILELMLVERDGDVDHVDLTLDGGMLTRADLDARFGEDAKVLRVHPGTPYPLAYHVEVPGAPFTCAVIARFDEEPTDAAVAVPVVLRRDQA